MNKVYLVIIIIVIRLSSCLPTKKTNYFQTKNLEESFSKNFNLKNLLKKDKTITGRINEKKIDKIFTYNKHFKNINYIFRRVFK